MKRAGHGELLRAPVVRVLENGLPERAVLGRLEALHHVRREQLDVLGVLRPLEHDRRGAEVVAAVHHVDLAGELRQEGRVLHGGVAAADHDRVGAAEEGGVAGGAVRHAARGQLILAGYAELLRLGAHREHHGAGADLLVAHVHHVNAAVLVGQLDPGRVVGDEARAEALRLVAELLHHRRPHHALGIAGVVLHVGRLLQQPAPLRSPRSRAAPGPRATCTAPRCSPRGRCRRSRRSRCP